MKISTYITFFLIVSGVLFIFSMMAQESADLYPEANINTSDWSDRYDYVNDINNTVGPLQNTFAKIEDEDTGWFTKLTSGIAAIPLAVVKIPTLLISGFGYGGSLVTGLLSTFSVPPFIILIVLVMIITWGIFKLIEIYQRWQI